MYRPIMVLTIAAGLLTAPCLALAQSGAPQTAQPAATPAKPAKGQTPGQIAARERQKKCGAEWKAAKAAGTVEKGTTWPKFWSACNKRLKSGG
ncbi:MAG TPA: hypothetical protein VG986_01460 [Pseudolabrys sp.]|nr:hypothetical protein [Pseudolabrys sp.]